MIINYDIETGKIVTTSYGMDEPWTDEDGTFIAEHNNSDLNEPILPR